MFIYLLAIMGVAGIHTLYFDRPLSELYFSPDGPDVNSWLMWIGDGVEFGVALGASVGLLVVWVSRVLTNKTDWGKTLNRDFSELFQGMSPIYLTGIAILSAFGEEILFRGWLQQHLGFVWTSLLFGALHLPMKPSHWPWTISAVIMGFVLGWLYACRGSITAPLIAHFTINYFNLHALARGDSHSHTGIPREP